ncbi:MAG: sulfatase-like hydrolase/transferase [Anaerolineaceae bacterium]|nr:sulfatase-like hydrolase/transferase [Anaerolineaceae bacterium]
MSSKPHIVIFNPDQWRGDVIGHVGNPVAVTPVLDQFIEQDAVSFQNAFCQNPVCTPSRCSFMTGWYPHVRGHRTMFHMLQPDEPELLKILKDNGYFVWWGGKNDLVPGQFGYDDHCDVKYQAPNTPERPLMPNSHVDQSWRSEPGSDDYYSFFQGKIEIPANETYAYDNDWAMIEGAVDMIRNAPDDQPLCIYLPLLYPHPPYGVEEPWYSMIDRDKIPPRIPAPENWDGKSSMLHGLYKNLGIHSWTEAQWTELRAVYYGMCARVDHQFGMILDALKEAGIYDDTAIFFFSDHGDYTGDYGVVEKAQNSFEDCLTNVPFAIKPPKDVPVRPGVRDALVELVDFSATVYDVTGIDPGYTYFGQSLLPLIAGDTDKHRDAVFCEGGRLQHELHAREHEAKQREGMLYWPRTQLQHSTGPEHTKATMCRTKDYKYVRRFYEQDELYDLNADPDELNNRIDDPALAVVKLGLMDRMLTFYQETSDVVRHEPDRRW